MEKLAVIDFDKTFINIDAGHAFVKRYSAKNIVFWGILRKAGIISRKRLSKNLALKMKEILNKEEILEFIKFIRQEVNPVILNEVERLTKEKVKVIVISATPNLFIQKFCELYNIDGYGSHEVPENGFRHLYGQEKLKFIEENFPKTRYDYYFTVSDSYSDKPLFDAFENSFLLRNDKLEKI